MDPATAALRASYVNMCNQLAEHVTQKPSSSNDGKSVQWESHYNSLVDRIETLRKMPGVAPEQNPCFELHEYR